MENVSKNEQTIALVCRANYSGSRVSAIRVNALCVCVSQLSTASLLLLMSVNGAKFGGGAGRVWRGGGQISTFDSGVK